MYEGTVLIVDDDEGMRKSLAITLRHDGYKVSCAECGVAAIERVKDEEVELVILDLKMPGADGLETLKAIKGYRASIPVIMITGFGSIETAVEAMKHGAFDYVTKPFETAQLKAIVRNALYLRNLARENEHLKGALQERFQLGNIVGKSARMQRVYDLIEKVAPTDATVVLLGESGTGKELVAKSIHYSSPRKNGPFIQLNCAALPDGLLDSELFGHEKGAFTGASSQRLGRFELAHGGTIFLDEIGDISPATQVRLLRILQEREFERLGGTRTIKADARVIVATNKDLEREMREGRFREDLYYRLNVIRISIPPLRERMEDLPLLVEHFLREFSGAYHKSVSQVAPEAMKALMSYRWPGNVRELRNAIERAVVLAASDSVTVDLLPTEITAGQAGRCRYRFEYGKSLQDTVDAAVEEIERDVITDALVKCDWRQAKVAGLLGISEKTLYNKMQKYRIRRDGASAARGAARCDGRS